MRTHVILVNKKYLFCYLFLFAVIFFLFLSFLNILGKIIFPTPAAEEKTVKMVSDNVLAQKQIALTFDDGPGSDTEEILRILRVYQVKATFFVIGLQVEKYQELLSKIAAEGHVIGNHTLSHKDLSSLSDKHLIEQQIRENERLIMQETGEARKIIRPPGGAHNALTDQVIKELGYKMVLWNIDSRDWANLNADTIVKKVKAQVKNGGVILLHDGGGNRAATIEALPEIIEYLRMEGYEFVTL